MRTYTKDMIARSILTHNVFRTAIHIFKYEDMSVTVLHENPSNGTFVQHHMFVQAVNSKQDAIEFIHSYLDKMGTR